MSPFGVRVTSDDEWPAARLSGTIDLLVVGEVEAALERAVPNRALGLVVDLSDVTFLDSAGIGLLFRLARRLAERQQQLLLVVPEGARTGRVLELAGIRHVARVVRRLDDAVLEET